MTCPRPHCGGLLFEDEGEWVCKSCSRRWTDAALDLERTRMSAPKAAQPSAIDEAMLDRRLDELLHDEEDGEPEEETIMAERCQKPRGRGRCKADAVPGSNFCRDCGAPPKPEARSPKRRGRPPRHSPAGGFDQGNGDGSMTGCDEVNHPAHYTMGKIEPIDAIEDWQLGFHLGNTVKYIARAEHKGNPLQDLKKARWYLDRHIQRLEKEAQ